MILKRIRLLLLRWVLADAQSQQREYCRTANRPSAYLAGYALDLAIAINRLERELAI